MSTHLIFLSCTAFPVYDCNAELVGSTGSMAAPESNLTNDFYTCQWTIAPENTDFDVIQIEMASFDFVNDGDHNCFGKTEQSYVFNRSPREYLTSLDFQVEKKEKLSKFQ